MRSKEENEDELRTKLITMVAEHSKCDAKAIRAFCNHRNIDPGDILSQLIKRGTHEERINYLRSIRFNPEAYLLEIDPDSVIKACHEVNLDFVKVLEKNTAVPLLRYFELYGYRVNEAKELEPFTDRAKLIRIANITLVTMLDIETKLNKNAEILYAEFLAFINEQADHDLENEQIFARFLFKNGIKIIKQDRATTVTAVKDAEYIEEIIDALQDDGFDFDELTILTLCFQYGIKPLSLWQDLLEHYLTGGTTLDYFIAINLDFERFFNHAAKIKILKTITNLEDGMLDIIVDRLGTSHETMLLDIIASPAQKIRQKFELYLNSHGYIINGDGDIEATTTVDHPATPTALDLPVNVTVTPTLPANSSNLELMHTAGRAIIPEDSMF